MGKITDGMMFGAFKLLILVWTIALARIFFRKKNLSEDTKLGIFAMLSLKE